MENLSNDYLDLSSSNDEVEYKSDNETDIFFNSASINAIKLV